MTTCAVPDCTAPVAHETHVILDQCGRPDRGFVYCSPHLAEHWREAITRLTFLEAQLTAQLERETSDQPALFDKDAR